MKNKHKHSELIKAWADGAEIEYLMGDGEWDSVKSPNWNENTSYRIKPEPKPEPKPDVVTKDYFFMNNLERSCVSARGTPNVHMTFDGETCQLKSVRMIGKPDPEAMQKVLERLSSQFAGDCVLVECIQVRDALKRC